MAHSPRRLARWLLAPVAGVLVAAGIGGSPAFAVPGYTADGVVNVRNAANTAQAPLTATTDGQALDIICQTYGQNIGGTIVWDYTKVNGYAGFVSDYYVNGTPFAVLDSRIPSCVRPTGTTWPSNAGAPGQCTYGALQQWHDDTGYYPELWGNAKDWAASAPNYGWKVVLDAEPRSIVVFQPGVQGADGTYGHVAWVESVESRSDGLYVHILEMNGPAGLWNYDRRTVKDVVGMSYILAPW